MRQVIKKAIIAGSVLAASVIPSASAAAGTAGGGSNATSIKSTSAAVKADKSNSNSSNSVAYVNKTVNYEALYYVKYSASETAYFANAQQSANNASFAAALNKSSFNDYSMPSYGGMYN